MFTLKTGFGSYNTQQSKRLKELCKKYNLKFGYDEIEDSFKSKYEIAGCYGAYMDEAIEKKFGKDFKKKLLKEADELIIANLVLVSLLFDNLNDLSFIVVFNI